MRIFFTFPAWYPPHKKTMGCASKNLSTEYHSEAWLNYLWRMMNWDDLRDIYEVLNK